MNKLSDKQIFAGLGSSLQSEKNLALKELYRQYFPVVTDLITKNNGTPDDASDVFQDAIVVFYEKIRLGELELSCSIQTYLYSVCRNLWLSRLRSKKRQARLDDQMESIPISEDSLSVLNNNERQTVLIQLLSKLGEDCKKVLSYYYFERLRMKEIASVMNFANEQVAKNKKSGCMKKLRSLVSDNPELQHILR